MQEKDHSEIMSISSKDMKVRFGNQIPQIHTSPISNDMYPNLECAENLQRNLSIYRTKLYTKIYKIFMLKTPFKKYKLLL